MHFSRPFRLPNLMPRDAILLLLFLIGGLTAADPVAGYYFNAGDTVAMDKNGFSWESKSATISAPPGQTETGVNFTFAGDPDPEADAWTERRFAFTPQTSVYLHERFYVPTNYFHRSYVGLTLTGDISTWQIGDIIQGEDGVSHGTLSYIRGQDVYLLFPDKQMYSTGVWTGMVTNLARSQSLPSVRFGVVGNDKVFAIWCDGYSASGHGPSMIFEMRSDMLGGSNIYYHFGADLKVTGTLPNSTSNDVPFIRTQDRGTWMDMVFRVTQASSETAEDGTVEFYLKRQGDTGYVRLLAQNNCKIGARAAGTPAYAAWQNAYLWGWWNSGVSQDTTIYVSEVELFQNKPVFLVPPPGNTAPVASNQSVSTPVDTATTITLAATDAEAGTLTYAIVAGPSHGALSVPDNDNFGVQWAYTPAAGFQGSDSFTFVANDGALGSNVATVSITVGSGSGNHPPVATAQSVTTAEDAAASITLAATDADGNPLTYAIATSPTHGTLSGSGSSRTYTPSANFSGSDSFTFTANDGTATSTAATVSITVTAVNDAPTAIAQSVNTVKDTAKAITLSGTDPEGSALTYAIAVSPTHGTLSGSGASRTYTPAAGYAGSDSFTFTVNDGSLTSPAATVSITVTAPTGGTGGVGTGGGSSGGCGAGGVVGLIVGLGMGFRLRRRR